MSKYTGAPCAHCGHSFTAEDDVVVCPICGAPHHRSCYRELGHCALEAEHSPDFVWKNTAEPAVAAAEKRICPRCNTHNPPEADFCQTCGSLLTEAERNPAQEYLPKMPFGSRAADEQADTNEPFSKDTINRREYAAFFGAQAPYFLRQQRLLAASKYGISWNWGAVIFSFFYFFYRKMYKVGLLLVAFYLASVVPALLCYMPPTDATIVMAGVTIPYSTAMVTQMAGINQMLHVLRTIVTILAALFANRLYLADATAKIRRTKQAMGDRAGTPDYFTALHWQGRTNIWSCILVFFGMMAFYSVLFSALGILPMV